MATRLLLIIRSSLLLLAFTASAAPSFAQHYERQRPNPGDVRLSLAGAWALPYVRVEDRMVALADGQVRGRFLTSYGSGAGASLLAELAAAGPMRAMSSLTLLQRSGSVVERTAGGDSVAAWPGSATVMATVGATIRTSERTPDLQQRRASTALRAGPTYAVEVPRRRADERPRRAMASWGVGLGAEAEVPLGRSATLQLAVEDHVMLANRAELARRVGEDFARSGISAQAQVDAPAVHVLLLRLGFAFTFR
jgi:hypothetical protein